MLGARTPAMATLTHPTVENGWFRERPSSKLKHATTLEVKQILHVEKSNYYDILVFESTTAGKVLVLNGIIQCIEREDFSCQEMIAHLPLSTHPNPKKVLVIGDSDGTIVREVLKHESVEHVFLCDVDEAVVRVSRTYFSHSASILSSPRAHILIIDRFKVLAENTSTFDIIIAENTESVGSAGFLFPKSYFREPYFQLLHNALTPEGHISARMGPIWAHPFDRDLLDICRRVFPVAECAYTEQGGLIIAAKAKGRDITKPIRSLYDTCYWNEAIHRRAFVFPEPKCVILEGKSAWSGQLASPPVVVKSGKARSEDSVICETLDVVLYSRYGFDNCAASYDGQFPVDSSWERTQKYLVDRESFIASNLRPPIIHFVDTLIKCGLGAPLQAYPSSGLWDLRDSHLSPMCEKKSPFFRIVQKRFNESLVYCLEPTAQQTSGRMNWHLVVPHAVTALQCLREEWGPLQENVVQKLVERGIPFQTWLPTLALVSPLRDKPRAPYPGLGFRPPAFRADFKDYIQYAEARDSLLRQPYARAALLKGGIVWRLVIEALGYAPAMEGPSESADELDTSYTLDGVQVRDDILLEEELELICGVYHVYTGQGRQVATMSWWPKPSAWAHSGLNVGYWSPSCEEWFQRRLELIRSNKASLKSGNEWRQGLSFHSRQTSRVIAANEQASAMFVAGHRFP